MTRRISSDPRAKEYDDRTGFRVRASRLKQDGEKPGVWTVDPDPEHPQKRPVIASDIRDLAPPKPAPYALAVDVDMTRIVDVSTFQRVPLINLQLTLGSVPIEIDGTVTGASHGA